MIITILPLTVVLPVDFNSAVAVPCAANATLAFLYPVFTPTIRARTFSAMQLLSSVFTNSGSTAILADVGPAAVSAQCMTAR